ncbi:MAG TPA: hypothetical protein VLM89_02325 [Phycisphaerae bacterium]|nr:hypothetical protein [Phycisphaerae bacterium]
MSSQAGNHSEGRSEKATGAGVFRDILANRGFLACALILLACTGVFEAMARAKNIQFRKLPVPLRKPLNLLDQSTLRQPIFTMDGSMSSQLRDGTVSPAVAAAFKQNGFPLTENARIDAKERTGAWQVTDTNPQTKTEIKYTIENETGVRDLRVWASYHLLSAAEIKPEILDSLGTTQYIQWALLDQTAGGALQPEDFVQLFVTYYTGAPDQVPHVPEECYMGGGYVIKNEFLVEVPLPALGPDRTVQVKALEFAGPSFMSQGTKIVMYVFHTNGRFCADRTCVRGAMADPFGRHAYFSKLEVSFGTSEALPPRDKAIEAGRRFLSIVIPVLLKDHWPDWGQVTQSERQGRTAGQPSGE